MYSKPAAGNGDMFPGFATPSLACGGSGVPTAWATVGGVAIVLGRACAPLISLAHPGRRTGSQPNANAS